MSGLDTGGGKAPRGMYKVRVSGVPEKGHYDTGNTPYYKFKFDLKSVDDPALSTTHTEQIVVFMMGPIAQAMGFDESPKGSGKYPEFDAAKCFGKVFYAEIIHEIQEKGKSAGKVFARLVKPSRTYALPQQDELIVGDRPVNDDTDIPF